MEEKKKFFDPVTWAKHSFVLGLIESGVISICILAALSEKIFGANNCLVNLLEALAVPLLLFIFVALLVTFIGGLISLIGLILTKENLRKSYFYAIISIIVSILIFNILAMGFIKSENQAMEMLCHNTIGYLNKQIVLTFENNDKTFKKENWCDFIKTAIEYDNAFKCYQDKTGPCSYAMNENIPADPNELPGDLVLLFESTPGWNQVGGADDVVIDRHGKPGANIAFADGHVEFVEADEIPNLRWTIEEASQTVTPDLIRGPDGP